SGAGRGGGGRRGGGGGGMRWSDGGKSWDTLENREIVRYDAATGNREVLVSASELKLAVTDYAWSSDGKKLLLAANPKRVLIRKPSADYWVLDRATHSSRKLGGDDPTPLLWPKFSPDGMRVAYVRGTNVYVEDLAGGTITALTKDGTDLVLNGVSDWVYDEEFGLADCFRWSPDGQRIAYWQFDQHDVPVYTLVNYTDGLYPTLFQYPYPKAGQTNSAIRLGVVSASGGATTWVKAPGNPRDIYIPRMEWTPKGDVIFQHLNRLQNHLQLMTANAATGDVRRLFEDKDAAWVEVNSTLHWLAGGKLLWTSERDGWRHAYTLDMEGTPHLVTNFKGDVISISSVDEKGGWLYFIASPDEPTRRYLYRTKLDGSGSPTRVTPASMAGAHTYNISPNGEWAIHMMSRFDQPTSGELIKLPSHGIVRPMNDPADARAKVAELMAGRTEFVQVDAGGGAMIDGWVMKPRNFDPAKKYPILVYVYGEPAGANAVDQFSGNRNLFHAAISDEGYLVASFDNAGTPSPKGRAWRKSIYGSVGVLASEQQAAALRSLAKSRPWVDLDRVAVWGWSGGGSMTDNLMFRSPELYKVGMSVAAVPDQALYDSIYQERYMGLPQTNAKGYHDGSPINFAEGLRGKLLIVHGTGDDNVHFQGDQELINRLVELGKAFDFMEYPNRTHGISEGRGTQLHVYSLISRYLMEHLPAGPR
ncbi:MAG TPA: S9 family peptidase, partial [Candidatus Solibacter sp.]|nr:S9 family peptidase [Candidatus Solibacter sp.]